MLIKRRSFLQSSALATASLLVPRFLKEFSAQQVPAKGQKILVVLQLTGGNDGLNTIVPVRNDLYYRLRPSVALAKEKTLGLTDEAGIHTQLPFFADSFHKGSMAVLNSVGYPNPNRSHFHSLDVWHIGSEAKEHLNTGWLGRYIESKNKGADRPLVVELSNSTSLALKGNKASGISMRDPKAMAEYLAIWGAREVIRNHHHDHHHQQAEYMYRTLASTVAGVDYIAANTQSLPAGTTFPGGDLGRDLRMVASLIRADIETNVYYLEQDGYDTHADQGHTHNRLFKNLNAGLEAFFKELKEQGRSEDVLVMVFSEFGRRVAQNASRGTDHGAAGNVLFFSGGLKRGGLLNELPDLANLDQGDLRYQVDFRQVYATVLKKWLGADDRAILGRPYDYLDFL